MKIAITGATGLVGSRVMKLLSGKYILIPVDVDITKREAVFNFLSKNSPDVIIHLAAKTDVDSCEKDKDQDLSDLSKCGIIKDGKLFPEKIESSDWEGKISAFSINTAGTKNLSDWVSGQTCKLIYISTDFVFYGDSDFYTEKSPTKPIDWYGQTKCWGEEIVSKLPSYLICRLAFPYGHKSETKKDFVWKMIELLETKDEVRFLSDQITTPTFIDDIAGSLDILIEKNEQGIFHVVGNSFISPFEAGELIAKTFGLEKTKINTITLKELYEGRAKRPFHVKLKNDKLVDVGFKPKTFEEGLSLIQKTA